MIVSDKITVSFDVNVSHWQKQAVVEGIKKLMETNKVDESRYKILEESVDFRSKNISEL